MEAVGADFGQMHTHTYTGGIIGGSKDQLWRPVVPRADVRHVGFSTNQLFCTAKETTAFQS